MVLLRGLGSSNPAFIRRVTTTATKAITPSQRLMRIVSGTHHMPDRRGRCRRLRLGTVVFNFRGEAGEPRDETADIKPLNSALSCGQSQANSPLFVLVRANEVNRGVAFRSSSPPGCRRQEPFVANTLRKTRRPGFEGMFKARRNPGRERHLAPRLGERLAVATMTSRAN